MIVAALLLALAGDSPPPPESAAPVQHLHEVVVDAIRNCSRSSPDEISVCARDRGFSERYRIQRLDPRFAERTEGKTMGGLVAGGPAGEGGCSTVGATGTSGCSLKDYNDWGAWKKKAKAEGRDFPW